MLFELKALIQSKNHRLIMAMTGLLLVSLWGGVAFWASGLIYPDQGKTQYGHDTSEQMPPLWRH